MDLKTFLSQHPEVWYVSVVYLSKEIHDIPEKLELLGKWEARLVTDDLCLWPVEDAQGSFTGDSPEEAMNALFTSYGLNTGSDTSTSI